jgi:NPCBM/NEW2 domain-containing protein
MQPIPHDSIHHHSLAWFMTRFLTALAAILIPVCRLSAAAPEVQVKTLDGRTLSGALKSITKDAVSIESQGAESVVKSGELHSLTLKPADEPKAEKPAAWVELTDGTRLPAASFLSKDGKVSLTLVDGEKLALTAKQVRYVRYSKLEEPDAEVAKNESPSDLLGIRKSGTMDFLEGVIGDITPEAVRFTVEGQTIPVNPSRIDRLVYAHRTSDGDGPTPACVVEESSGALLKARAVDLVDDKLQVTLLTGGTLVRPLENIRTLDFSSGKFTYLSDLKPESVQWTPFFDLGKQSPALARFLGPRFDRGREDDVMRLEGKEYQKGISLTSRTEMTYKLPARSRRFQALAGIDDGVGDLGSVDLVIKGDGRQLYSGKLTGKGPAAALDLDLSGVRRLTILVDFGDDLDVADHLDLCEARIVK